ncbi:uncharacterized protein LOC112104265 [Terrapene carolina triunguis]|uniref:uncharacterized protein LOC112104265 n=1 Tax=Terrapene triunguis TaxID=2587831 RepID=UPI0011566E97|nr:uncharacterized protein LOC112104265 [Terrapene carolina triunguis]XP_029770125.1 uncharacterized protein LOC112104265 [Terrapene carolina triunguis]
MPSAATMPRPSSGSWTRARCSRCPASGTLATTSSPGAASPGSLAGSSSTGPDSTAFPSTEPSAMATGTSSAGSAATPKRPTPRPVWMQTALRSLVARHNAIQNQLVKAILPSLGNITINSAIPGTDSRLRPDIAVTDAEKKKVLMVDMTVPFENRSPAFHEARARKALKCTPLADTLRAQGYEVQIHALIVGALGSWDPHNKAVLRACGVDRCYARLMRQLMVSDTIRWSRDIYMEHITGHRRYQDSSSPNLS